MQFDKAVAGGFIAPPIASALHKSLADFQDACQALFDFRYMPIPFVRTAECPPTDNCQTVSEDA
eukprot:478654-Amphidinium_carterae.1